jgi:hypothetical protein
MMKPGSTPGDKVDASMLFAIGPDRKLFETSLREGADRDKRRPGAHGLAHREG